MDVRLKINGYHDSIDLSKKKESGSQSLSHHNKPSQEGCITLKIIADVSTHSIIQHSRVVIELIPETMLRH